MLNDDKGKLLHSRRVQTLGNLDNALDSLKVEVDMAQTTVNHYREMITHGSLFPLLDVADRIEQLKKVAGTVAECHAQLHILIDERKEHIGEEVKAP